MNLTAAVDERNGVTLVELEVENPTRTPRRVRIRNELSGTLLPPRRHGCVVDGFDEDGVTIAIAAGARRAVGYACRAGAESPPATLVGSEPCESEELEERSADDIVAALGDPRPPRDAVTPEIRPPESRTTVDNRKRAGGEQTEAASDDTNPSETPRSAEDGVPRGPKTGERRAPDTTDLRSPECGNQTEAQPSSPQCRNAPPAVDAWLTRAADRIESGDPVDAASLRTVARRADRLAGRAGR